MTVDARGAAVLPILSLVEQWIGDQLIESGEALAALGRRWAQNLVEQLKGQQPL